MMTRSLALLVLWIALLGELSVANVLSGVLLVALVSWLFVHDEPQYTLRPLAALRLAAHVLVNLVSSSARVVLAVIAPTPQRSATSIQQVQLAQGSVFVGAIVSNAITLTPGTMSLDLDPSSLMLSVHVLGTIDEASFRADVLSLEQLVAKAVRLRSE
jgi:Multisubunit Na+/H+ antiporter, MnhE subunit